MTPEAIRALTGILIVLAIGVLLGWFVYLMNSKDGGKVHD